MVVLVLVPFELVASSKFGNGGSRGERPKQSPQSPKYPQQNNRNAKYSNPTQAIAYVGLADPQLGSKYKPVI